MNTPLPTTGDLWGTAAQVTVAASFGLVILGLTYAAVLLVLSRRRTRRETEAEYSFPSLATPTSPFVVLLMPALNEDRVIGASITRIIDLDHDRFAILAIDDGSDDDTASIVSSFEDDRVHLLSRTAPNARQGKGAALNAAYRYLVTSDLLAGKDPSNVVVVVLDADGRLESAALDSVLPLFADPAVGGVQIGVRINNRHTSWLARMQDFEFVVFTEVFQRARRHLGSVGLGGNGQFMRLSALMTLGDEPWSRSLTEDLDLGVRLLARGWRNEYCGEVAVHQQGLTSLRRLIRQRTRWFQGHLQSWALLPTVLRHTSGATRRDLTYHLTSPVLILLASLLTCSFLAGLVAQVLAWSLGSGFLGWWLIGVYLLSFVPAVLFSAVYRRAGQHQEPEMGVLRAFAIAHGYVVYSLMWYAAGWRATARMLLGRSGWAKTARTTETASTTLGPDATGVTVLLDGDARTATASLAAATGARAFTPRTHEAVAGRAAGKRGYVVGRTGDHR